MRSVAAILGVLLSTSALAADISPGPSVPVTMPPVSTWTGFYLGGNAGYGWNTIRGSGFAREPEMSGFIGGGQIGFNWQSGNLVLGIEADAQATEIDRTNTVLFFGVPVGTAKVSMPWFATLRGRIGYAAGPWLVYLTGGGAYSRFSVDVTGILPASDHDHQFGYAVGGGFEWKFAPHWSVKAEYLRMETGDTLFALPFDVKSQTNIVRGGINVHFNP